MPTTRAMARQASTADADKENAGVSSLRQKPVRRVQRRTASVPKQAAQSAPPAMPLSPKKITQVSQARTRLAKGTKAAGAVDERKAGDVFEEHTTRRQTRRTAAATPSLVLQSGLTSEQGSRATTTSRSRGGQVSGQIELNGARGTQANLSTVAGTSAQNRVLPGNRDLTRSAQGTPARSLRGTPMENKRLDLSPQSFSNTSLTASQNDSDDELCGPKTPLVDKRHDVGADDIIDTTTIPVLGDVIRPSTSDPAIRPLRTPITQMNVSRLNEQYPHTQKVPLRPADTSSPRRPMSVARGSSVAYVFHPLPKASRVHSPLRGPYQWPVTPSDDGDDDPLEDAQDADSLVLSRTSSRSSRPSTPASRRSTLVDAVQTRNRLTQLFAADSDDEADSDEADEISHPGLKRGTPHNRRASADYVSRHSSFSSESAHDDLDDSRDSFLSSSHLSSVDEESLATEEDDSLMAPELDSQIFQSTPMQNTPAVSTSRIESSPLIEDELAGTPTLPRLSAMSNSSLRPPYRTRVSFALDELADQETPRVSATRPSLGPFKTPRMRTALEEFDFDASTVTETPSTAEGSVARRRTMCIDPSMLSHEDAQGLTRKDSAQYSTASPSKALPDFATSTDSDDEISPPIQRDRLAGGEEEKEGARLSLFIHTDGLIESPHKVEDPSLDDVDATVLVQGRPSRLLDQASGLGISGTEIDGQDQSMVDASVIQHNVRASPMKVSLDSDLFSSVEDHAAPETPHYALPTVSFDARRKSMPLLSALTPQTSPQLRSAETAIKPRVSPFPAKVWLERQHEQLSQPVSRRQSIISLSPSLKEDVQQPGPSFLPRATSSMGLRKTPSTHQVRHSIIGLESTSTPSATPRPRCYTPTLVYKSMRAASLTKSPSIGQPSPAQSPRIISPQSPPSAAAPAITPVRPLAIDRRAAFTPHPAAPLEGVVAHVEIFTRAGLSASTSFINALHRLGAKTSKSFGERVTHVVYKDGSPALLQKIRLAKKEGWSGCVVNSRWVTDCDALGARVSESSDEYAVDLDLFGSARRRKSKSMEPHALQLQLGEGDVPSLGGSLRRKSRMSVASSVWAASPLKGGAGGTLGDDGWHFSDEEGDSGQQVDWNDESTPVQMPRQRAVPGSVPVDKVRKFQFGELEGGATRRMTAWGGNN